MIGRNVLIQILSGGFGSFISFLTLSLAARLFGPSILGNLAYVISFFGLIFAFSDLGFSRAHVHFTAALKKPKQTLGTFLRLKSTLLALSAVAALIFGLTNPDTFKGLFVLILFYQLITRLAETVFITFEGLQLSLPQNMARLISKFFRLGAVLILGLVLKNNLSYGLTFIVEGLALAIIALILINRFKPLVYSKALANKYWRYSLPFFVILPLSYLQNNGVVVILKKLSATTQVGYFSASLGMAGFVKSLFGALMVFFFPQISAFFKKKDFKSIQRYADLSVKYLLLLFTPLLILLYLLRQEVVTLVLGSSFIPAVPVFSLFLLGTFILMLVAPYDQILFATQNHQPLVKISLVSLILSLSASFFLIPSLGAQGAVISLIIAWLVSGSWHLFLVKKNLKLKLLPRFFSFFIPALIILVSFEKLIVSMSPGLIIKLVLVALSLIIYLLTLAALKTYSIKDIRYFFSLLKLKK